MRKIFLFGDVSFCFKANLREFVNCCGKNPVVAVLMMNSASKKYEKLYAEPLQEQGVKPFFVYPDKDINMDFLNNHISGFLMAGGHPEIYSEAYVKSKLKELIVSNYQNGIPYAGVSAGAIMATSHYIDSPAKTKKGKNEICLITKFNDKVGKGEVRSEGLNLLDGVLLEPHFSEWGLFPSLLEKINLDQTTNFGIGFDEPIGLEITNEDEVKVIGNGRAYFIKKTDPLFEIDIKEPGEKTYLKRYR